MTAGALPVPLARARAPTAAQAVTAVLFAWLFFEPMRTLVRDWLTDPEAGHGLLLAPIALYMAWKAGLAPQRAAQPKVGCWLLAAGVALRCLAGLAAEMFTLRLSMWMALAGLVVCAWGLRQLVHWWLPLGLLLLSVPLPATVLATLALPLQLEASRMGAALLEWRHVPVRLAGNVIHLPGHSLFVTEACSGLRSITALLSLGLLIGAMWLRSAPLRLVLLAISIPVAVLTNGVRVFLTGFLIYYVDPSLGTDMMHYSEGWALFVVSFALLGGVAWMLAQLHQGLIEIRAGRVAPDPQTSETVGAVAADAAAEEVPVLVSTNAQGWK